MSFFSHIFNTFHFNNTNTNKYSQKNEDRCLKNSVHSDTSSQYSGYSDGNSEADINTLRMVKIMTGFHNYDNYKNSCSSNRNGGSFQVGATYKTVLEEETLSKHSSKVSHFKQETMGELKNIHQKGKNNSQKKRKIKNGITRRQKYYVHDNMWSKSKD